VFPIRFSIENISPHPIRVYLECSSTLKLNFEQTFNYPLVSMMDTKVGMINNDWYCEQLSHLFAVFHSLTDMKLIPYQC